MMALGDLELLIFVSVLLILNFVILLRNFLSFWYVLDQDQNKRTELPKVCLALDQSALFACAVQML